MIKTFIFLALLSFQPPKWKYIIIYYMVHTSSANYSLNTARRHETQVIASQPKIFYNRDSALMEFGLDRSMIMPGSLVKAARIDSVKLK